MEQWSELRRRVLVEGVSRRQVLRETGMHWKTLAKILENSEPPGYRQEKRGGRPKLGEYLERIEEILGQDARMPRKQRHTAKRIRDRLKEWGHTGGHTVVKEVVRELGCRRQEVFMPLTHPPGEAQVDLGHALVNVAGKLGKVAFFVMSLPHSGAVFVMASERECTESFWEGHVRASGSFGGVPRRTTCDDTSIAVSKIIGRERRLTRGFLRLQSHHLSGHHFCRPARGDEKGVVEGAVKSTRPDFFVPVPQVTGLDALDVRLLQQCTEDRGRRLRGKAGTKSTLLPEDQAAFLPLPATAFPACRQVPTAASPLSLVRFDDNDHPVPVQRAHHPVVVKAGHREVTLFAQGEEVARHRRVWERERVRFDPLHHLALLERKPGALDHARPLAGWILPECFVVLRRRSEARSDGHGTREHIRVLRLLEHHPVSRLRSAVESGLRVGAITRDAIAQFLYPPADAWQTTFGLAGHPHLRHVRVAAPDLGEHQVLMGGAR